MENQSRLLDVGRECILACIDEVKPRNLIAACLKIEENCLSCLDQNQQLRFTANCLEYEQIMIVGGGKASGELAVSLINFLQGSQSHLSCIPIRGVISVLNSQTEFPKLLHSENVSLEFVFASHPLPDAESIRAARAILDLTDQANEKTLVLALLSGGGSALMCCPAGEITLEEKQRTTKLLLASGASIDEINTVRKHMSRFKGGNLGIKAATKGACVLSLLLSDVVNDNIATIASGPTTPDESTFTQALSILTKYELLEKLPSHVKTYILEGVDGKNQETMKTTFPLISRICNVVIGSAKDTRRRAMSFLKERSIHSVVFSDSISGEASQFGFSLPSFIQTLLQQYKDEIVDKHRIAFIGTGEFTVTFCGTSNETGRGGRNQEMLLAFLIQLRKLSSNQDLLPEWLRSYEFAILSAAFDGIEGNSPSAGAFVDGGTLAQIETRKEWQSMEDFNRFLQNHDSHAVFSAMGNDITTGNTGTNVNDMLLIILQRNSA